MKRVMLFIYKVCFSTYFYNQKMDIEKASETGFVAVRNFAGAIFFMAFILFTIVFENIFNIKFGMLGKRYFVYPLFLIVILAYMRYSKKYMKPIFKDLQLDEKYKDNNWPYIFLIVFLGLYCGGMFVLARLVGRLFN